MRTTSLNDATRHRFLIETIKKKDALRNFYDEAYEKFAACLKRCPEEKGIILELGSGGGFIKERLPEVITSDTIPYPNVDQIVDATQLPFDSNSIKAIFLLNTLHHISNVRQFFLEADRCLMEGGRIFITDQHPGFFSKPILKWFHHEPFDMKKSDWHFESSGPLSGANGALAWIVFQRDRKLFEAEFPRLKIVCHEAHTPLLYWLSGGLKRWSLAPRAIISEIKKIEERLIKLNRNFGSFVDIELVKL